MINFKALVIAACFIGTAAMGQTSINVTIDDARAIATQALFSGDPALALDIAQAILAQVPDDRAALLVVAAAAPRMDDPTAGRQAGARAWSVSQTDIQRYEAARLTALAAANEGRFTLSTFWLRRALTVAPNDAERQRTLQDARAVTRRNPWSTQLSFSLVPSSNVNGGAEDDEAPEFLGLAGNLSEAALALAGWRASLGFGTQYRLHENARSRTTVGLQIQSARVRLSGETAIPDEAFDTDTAQLFLRYDRALENGVLSLNISRAEFGYRKLDSDERDTEFRSYDIWRIGLDRRFQLSDSTMMTLSGGNERLDYSDKKIGQVDRKTLATSLSQTLNNDDQISVTFSISDSTGENPNFTSRENRLRLGYSWAEPVGPLVLAIGGGFAWSDYPDYSLVAAGRQDTTVFANMNIGFPQIEYAGFSPGLRIDASRSDSNVSRFDRTTLSVGLTINSSF